MVAALPSVAQGLAWFQKDIHVDLLMMDIQLSDGNCFEIFQRLKLNVPVIFTTAYDNFALQAFKVNSIDYLMKPIDFQDLKNALDKFLRVRHQALETDFSKLADAFLKRESTRFIGRINNQMIYVKARDIAFLQFLKGTTLVTTFQQNRLPIDYSLEQVERMLDKTQFFRVNRQFIVHIDAIKKILTYYNSRLILQLQPHADTDVIISRERVSDFKNWLEGRPTEVF